MEETINQSAARGKPPARFRNRLWQLRRERGLEQKQVARLLGYKTSDQLSRFERGTRLPKFENLLKLAVIYRASLEEMFDAHLAHYRAELRERIRLYAKSLPVLSAELTVDSNGETQEKGETTNSAERESTRDAHLCFYAALLETENPSEAERRQIRRHLTRLLRTLAYL